MLVFLVAFGDALLGSFSFLSQEEKDFLENENEVNEANDEVEDDVLEEVVIG